MRICTSLIIIFCSIGTLLGQNIVKGRITSDGKPLPSVHITNIASGTITGSDDNGLYVIQARPKEELMFTYLGMDTISIIVEDVTHILNIEMYPKVEQLDEVVVEKKISRQKKLAMDYFTDSTVVNTSFGYISPATSAYHLKVIDGSEFHPGLDLLSAIASRRSGINVETYYPDKVPVRTLFMTRTLGSSLKKIPVLYEVDGMIHTDPPNWLDVSMVLRVGIIPGLQAVWRYGHIASGGVVVINTVNGVHGLREENSNKHYDRARLRNNFVTGKVISNTELKEEYPSYLKMMDGATSLEETLRIYTEYEKLFSKVPYFYLDCYRLMFEKYGGKEADEILDENVVQFQENPVWLKVLAYLYESQNRFEKAHELYKRVYMLRPEYAQSFVDMANSYRNLGLTESATSLFARHAYLQEEGLLPTDSLDLSKIVGRELDNLFAIDNNATKIRERTFNLEEQGISTRLVFEWNDSEAEFDLQFVNPNNQYFNWKHTIEDMPERIRSEKKLGYSMADFLLDDELPGTWKVNATYHGNKQLTPTYLKATIYRNYGSKLQSKEIKVFRLGLKGANQFLFDLELPSLVVRN